jgi:hypothetical protein
MFSALPDYLCALYPFQHTSLRVRPAPGIPCALCFQRDENEAKPGRKSRRGNAEAWLFENQIRRRRVRIISPRLRGE